MELNYSLTENDYLQQQLYLASKNEFFKRERRITNVGVIILILIIVLFTILLKEIVFICASSLMLIVYCCISSRYLRWALRVRLKKYVDSVYLKKSGIITNIKFEENHILTSTSIMDSKLRFIGFQTVSEIEDYFFITFITDENFIIPKKYVVDIEALRSLLESIAEKRGIEFISELDWKWK